MSSSRPQSSTPTVQRQTLNMTVSEYRPNKGHKTDHDPYSLNFLFSNDVVMYKCNCDNFRRLNVTYFCRHCMALRCRSCVAHEVDSQYCQHCLEYIPTIDPKIKMNKCASCHQCPFCQHLLSTSVLSISSPINEQPQQQDEIVRRTCQLVCEFCRWSSETFVIEGSRTNNNLADVEVQNSSRIAELMSFYEDISQKELADKKKKKRRFHGNTMDLFKKYGYTLSPKLFERMSARTDTHAAKYNPEPKTDEEGIDGEVFKQAEALEPNQLDKLDVDLYYDQNFNLENISSIDQRLAQVEIQPVKVSDFKPISKTLSVKRSLRCKECERNLCRSEYSPLSIRFKIQSAAYYHIPELKLRTDVYPVKLKCDEYNIVEFTLQNQTLSGVKIKLNSIDAGDNDLYELVLPNLELNLGAKDDTADYDYVPFNMRPLNEETQVVFQGLFKIGFYIKLKPKRRVERLPIKFIMEHDVLHLQNPRETEKIDRMSHIVQVSLGPVE